MGAKLALLLAAFGALGHAWAQGPCEIRTSPESARALLEAKTELPVTIPALPFYETLARAARLLDPNSGYVLLGVEGKTQTAKFEPIAEIQSDEPLTLGTIFSTVLRQVPDERCVILGHRLVNYYPSGSLSGRAQNSRCDFSTGPQSSKGGRGCTCWVHLSAFALHVEKSDHHFSRHTSPPVLRLYYSRPVRYAT